MEVASGPGVGTKPLHFLKKVVLK